MSGSTSPEGSLKFNARLSVERMNSLENLIKNLRPALDVEVEREIRVFDWERLSSLALAGDMTCRAEISSIVSDTSLVDAQKIARLHRLDGGRAWPEMLSAYYPMMRTASAEFIFAGQMPSEPAEPFYQPSEPDDSAGDSSSQSAVPAETAEYMEAAQAVETEVTEIAEYIPVTKRPLYLALSTNALYDILALPNIGFEAYLGRDFSVKANWIYGWWDCNHRHRYWRAYGGDISVRRYFGKAASVKPLTGHHAGVYAQAMIYDFEWGGKGYMAGTPGGNIFDRANYAFGAEYGYTLPLTRRLNIDFTAGIGYWGGRYYEYIPVDNHYVWQTTKNRRWFGPTKVEVSLVWLIGHGNVNAGKGGSK